MAATLLDGAAIAEEVYSELKHRITAVSARGARPGLAVILVGDDPASAIYVKNKVRACDAAGLHSEVHRFDAACSEADVLAQIAELNRNAAIHGILVQIPLPPQLDAERLLQSVDPTKDVDGFNWRNMGAMVAGRTLLAPCTALGVMTILRHTGVPIEGINATVVGRSIGVGRPVALMLIAAGATVTVCTSKTRDLRAHTLTADILIVAVGRAKLIDGTMIKPGATVIDVGINRLPGGKLVGDVDFESASAVAGRITPVPGGVGRMTVAMLLANTVTAAERTLEHAQ